jgi:raffinose/stachyose/melibiose transport system permease protein
MSCKREKSWPRCIYRERRSKSAVWGSLSSTLLAGLISLLTFIPFFWVIATSVKDRKEVTYNRLGFPQSFHPENYLRAWTEGHFEIYFKNSLIQVFPTVVAILFLSLMAAYAFAQFKFPGKEGLFTLFLVGLTIPVGVLIIPLFYQMLDLKLINTLWAIILPQIAIGLPFAVLLLRTFIQELPGEIIDAGRIDGCGNFDLLWHIVFPLSKPAMLSLFVFNFMWNWNQFLLPVVLIQDESMRTLPLGLNYFLGRYVSDLPVLMAGATISFIPIVIIYIIFQRQFIRGIVAGAVK